MAKLKLPHFGPTLLKRIEQHVIQARAELPPQVWPDTPIEVALWAARYHSAAFVDGRQTAYIAAKPSSQLVEE